MTNRAGGPDECRTQSHDHPGEGQMGLGQVPRRYPQSRGGAGMGPFRPVKTANGVTLDFDTREEFRPGHYAFLVSDAEFDAAFARIRAHGVQYYADPRRAKPGEINHLHGGRGVYFDDPNGHVMEIITHPYGDRPEQI